MWVFFTAVQSSAESQEAWSEAREGSFCRFADKEVQTLSWQTHLGGEPDRWQCLQEWQALLQGQVGGHIRACGEFARLR